MTNLNICFSNAYSLNCKQCITPTLESNVAIKQALEDNTFTMHVRYALTTEINTITFLGSEPSINGEYFSKFICNLLDYSPYIQSIIVLTNGQSNTLYQNLISPLYCYCFSHKRNIKLTIQFNLSGPPDIHNKYYGENSSETCIRNLANILKHLPLNNNYLRLCLSTNSILQGYEIEHYSIKKWKDYMFDVYCLGDGHFLNIEDNQLGKEQIILQVPDTYTVSQGQALKRWKDYIDLSNQKPHCIDKTIDYLGNLYDCCLLVNNNITQEQFRTQFENTMDTLVSTGEAIEQNRDKLFNAISSIYCWGTENKQLDDYIRLLGNGFLL